MGTQHVTARIIYRLERIDLNGGDEVAVISSTGSFKTDSAPDAPFMKGDMNGKYRLDLGASRLLSATTDMAVRILDHADTARMRMHSEIRSLP